MKKLWIAVLGWFLLIPAGFSQDTVIVNGYNVFHYPSGMISSEGTMVNGQPDGYWKTFYENGVLKTEGNRKNFQLDSTWRFFSDSGKLTLEINYKEGMKNGIRRTYLKTEIIEENFVNDVKQGWCRWLYPDGVLKRKVFFADGREEGQAREYAHDGTVITISEYKKGYLISNEMINRKREGLKHGVWKEFYPGEQLKTESTFNYGKIDGYLKEFDVNGNLLSIRKFSNGEEIFDAPELASYEVRTQYYRNGKPKVVASYKDGIAEGTRREYDQNGNIVKGAIYKNGNVLGEGIIDEAGYRQGPWKEYFETGELFAEGNYKDNKRVGPWKFYFADGKIEQTGTYNNAGNPEGLWKWYYESGNLKRQEEMRNGKGDGLYEELSDSAQVIVKGTYSEGKEEGEWLYEINDDKVTGSYVSGKKEGEWKSYYKGQLYYQGNYIEGLADGEHILYWDNGKVKEKGNYIAGKKEGTWYLYSYEGERILSLQYEDGIEVAIDGSKIDD